MAVRSNQRYASRITMATGALIFLLWFVFEHKGLIPESKYVGKVNGFIITNKMLDEFVSQGNSAVTLQDKKFALDVLIDQEIMKVHARKSGMIKKELQPIFDREVEYAKRNLLIQALYNYLVEQPVNISEIMLKRYYASNRFGAYYAIAVSKYDDRAQEKIQMAKSALEKKIPFDEVLRQYSDSAFRNIGGFLGYFELKNPIDFEEPFLTFAQQLPTEGDHSQIFDTATSYMIMYRKRNPNFKEVKETIKQRLTKAMQQKNYDEMIKTFQHRLLLNQTNIQQLLTYSAQDFKKKAIANRELIRFSNGLDPVKVNHFYWDTKAQKNIDDFTMLNENEITELVREYGMQTQMVRDAISRKLHKKEEFKVQFKMIQDQLRNAQGPKIIEFLQAQADIQISDNELREYYAQNQEEFRKSNLISLQKLVVKDKELADQLYTQASRGANFDLLVKRNSIDEYAQMTVGKTPALTSEDLKENYNEINALPIGGVCYPIREEFKQITFHNLNKKVVTSETFTIYKVLKKTMGAVPAFSLIKNKIWNRLYYHKLNDWVRKLERQYNIKVVKKYDNIEMS